ncbi:hypothetical protein HMPREF1990_00051 [Porphyromonas gingivalis W4087]|nr:hypothetical protein HMPREF1990_00051 [Porphyromonas gingivalis W4087]
MRIQEERELSFHSIFPYFSHIRHFLCVFPSGRSFSFRGNKKLGGKDNKV